jgi:dTDP-4-amino-4,6-dideoxy-D-galactose acyltransferase
MAGILDVSSCRPREWDSAFFGVRIAEVAARRPAADELHRIAGQSDDAGIDCLYLLADAADADTLRAAEQNGFSLVDIRLTLDCELGVASRSPSRGAAADAATASSRGTVSELDLTANAGAQIRAASATDLTALKTLARTSHRNTRFYRDPRFDRERCDELYAVWIERSINGELADAVWVVDVGGAACGYLTIRADTGAPVSADPRERRASTIGLIAIDPRHRGRGYGDALLRHAQTWTSERGLRRVRVVTQGNDPRAIRFYERAGFLASRVELWYHRWRSPPKEGAHAAAR